MNLHSCLEDSKRTTFKNNNNNLKNQELYKSLVRLNELLINKDYTVPIEAQIFLHDALFCFLEIFSKIPNTLPTFILLLLRVISGLSVITTIDAKDLEISAVQGSYLKKLEHFLSYDDVIIRDQVIICLGNLIASSKGLIKTFYSQKTLISVLAVMNDINNTNDIVASGIWLIFQLARLEPIYEEISVSIVTVTSNLWSNDETVVKNCLSILMMLSFKDDKFIKLIESSNCIKKIIEFAYINKRSFYLPCIRIIGNMLTIEEATKTLLNNDVLKLLDHYLASQQKQIISDVLWCLKQLIDNPPSIINQVIESDRLMVNLITILFSDVFSQTNKDEVLKIILTMIQSGDLTTVEWFISNGILDTLKEVLTRQGLTQMTIFCSTSIIETLLNNSYDSKVASKERIMAKLSQLNFIHILDVLYNKRTIKNGRHIEQIQKILDLLYCKDHEEMVMN